MLSSQTDRCIGERPGISTAAKGVGLGGGRTGESVGSISGAGVGRHQSVRVRTPQRNLARLLRRPHPPPLYISSTLILLPPSFLSSFHSSPPLHPYPPTSHNGGRFCLLVLFGRHHVRTCPNASTEAASYSPRSTVKGPSELKLSITIDPSKTVADLKEAIAAKSDVEKERQRLIYSGALPRHLTTQLTCRQGPQGPRHHFDVQDPDGPHDPHGQGRAQARYRDFCCGAG